MKKRAWIVIIGSFLVILFGIIVREPFFVMYSAFLIGVTLIVGRKEKESKPDFLDDYLDSLK